MKTPSDLVATMRVLGGVVPLKAWRRYVFLDLSWQITPTNANVSAVQYLSSYATAQCHYVISYRYPPSASAISIVQQAKHCQPLILIAARLAREY